MKQLTSTYKDINVDGRSESEKDATVYSVYMQFPSQEKTRHKKRPDGTTQKPHLFEVKADEYLNADGSKTVYIDRHWSEGCLLKGGLVLNKKWYELNFHDLRKKVSVGGKGKGKTESKGGVFDVVVVEKTTADHRSFIILDIFPSETKSADYRMKLVDERRSEADVELGNGQFLHFEEIQVFEYTCTSCSSKVERFSEHDASKYGSFRCPVCVKENK